MLILVLNAGSSSLKFNLIDISNEESIADGTAERIGISDGFIKYNIHGTKSRLEISMEDHSVALSVIMDKLYQTVLIGDQKVFAIGHRVVHGGVNFVRPILITKPIIDEIEKLSFYAPLHNPASVLGIQTAQKAFPDVPQVAVFDTSFHHTMPDYAYTYGIPYELSQKFALRRYGFHGTSHKYVAGRAAVMAGRPIDAMKIITCHIGNGSSVTAVKYGVSVDTSMGLTPMEGVIMGTRCGNLDPGVLITIAEHEGLDAGALSDLLNKRSGLLGISGISSDCREIEMAVDKSERARLAFSILSYGIIKYIGSYAAAMNGVDAIIFTAGIGENSAMLRSSVCDNLTFLGVEIDRCANAKRDREDLFISTNASKVLIAVVHTDEELMIARDTMSLLKASQEY